MSRWPAVPSGRTSAAIAVIVAACLCAAAPAGADDSGPRRGEATAYAQGMSFSIKAASAEIGWGFGVATSNYQDATPSAEAMALDMSVIETLFGLPQCDGKYPPLIGPGVAPPTALADLDQPGATEGISSEAHFPRVTGAFPDLTTSTGQLMGSQTARVSRRPSASASTDIENQAIGPVFVSGARTSSSVSFDDGVRKATATMAADQIRLLELPGLGGVVINSPVWTATAYSGAETRNESSFTFDSVRFPTLFGPKWVRTTADFEREFALFKGVAESVLGILGLKIHLPEPEPPSTAGVTGARISPLVVEMSSAPLGAELLRPLFNSTLMAELKQRLLDEDCRNSTTITVLNAVVGALDSAPDSDSGIYTRVGGAEAFTADTDFGAGFEPFPPPTVPPPPEAAPTDPVGSGVGETGFEGGAVDDLGLGDDGFGDGTFDDLGLGDEGFGDGTFDETGFDDTGLDLGAVEDGAFDEAAAFTDDSSLPEGSESADPAGRGTEEIAASRGASASSGSAAAIVVGVVGLLGAIGLSVGDRVVGMRNRRRIA